ncbi:MAG TPA: IS1595 family transposase [Terriglobales bacterium]|nr:IS1595 family transposase [Terriglobales bacterium]
MDIREAHERFATDEQCLAYIEQMRWPDGVVRCSTCGGDNVKRVERKADSKNRRKWFYLCVEPTCHNQFTPTSGTIFHSNHLPLIVWFQAIALMLNAKKGLSAMQLQRDLGIGGYKTAWYLNHRIREAMREGDIPLLGGIVEVDETYIGGKMKGRGVGEAIRAKEVVIGVRQRGGELRFFHVPDATSKTLGKVIKENISKDVELVMTDELNAYPGAMIQAGIHGKKHKTIKHISGSYVRGNVHTNTVESAFSLLKRGLIGSFHRISIKHLQRYLDGFSYRFNRRDQEDTAFPETVRRLAGFAPLSFDKLTLAEKF